MNEVFKWGHFLVGPPPRTRRESKRCRQLVRVLRVIQAIRGGTRDIDALAAHFKVSTRTIRRDIEALRDAGARI